MGCCFSSEQQPSQSPTSPASYAAAVASNALHSAANYIDPSSATSAPLPAPTAPNVKQVIPNAQVFRMPDGDTFTCSYTSSTGAKATARVRILGIDCPETRQNYGREAGDLGRSLINNRVVTLHVHDTDRYGRIVADVIMSNGQSFGEAMLAAGAAWHYKAYDKRERLARLETEARQARRGLWAFARPQEPWEYRKRIRNSGK